MSLAAAEVLAVCGLGAEARIARGPGVRALAGGGDAARLADAIERAIDGGVAALASFGIAGALAPRLGAGMLLVADAVCLADGTRWPTDPRWSRALRATWPEALAGALAGSATVVADPAEKAALHARTGALAVDMESHTVARIAAARGLPFVVLRAVADPAGRRVPAAARAAMRPEGGVDAWAVLRSLAGDPAQLAGLLRVAADARRALAALARGRRRLGHGLCCPDLDQPPLHVV